MTYMPYMPYLYLPFVAYPSGYEITSNSKSNTEAEGAIAPAVKAGLPGTNPTMCRWVASILEEDNLLHLPSDIRPTLLVPSHFDREGMLRQKGRVLAEVAARALESHLWAAGFSFCRAKVTRCQCCVHII